MKKIYSLLFIVAFSIVGYSQCIIGPDYYEIGGTYTFTSSATAQCQECYDWDINGSSTSSDNNTVGNLQIIGTDINQSVSIKILAAGSFTIQLTYFDETGCHSCSQTFGALPTVNCFGFDPVVPSDIDASGTLNYGYLGSPYSAPLPSAGLTFTWYFKFQDGTLLQLDGQNPTFREKCPNNPVKSFACLVSNGVQTKQYRSIVSGYSIPGFSGANTPTCFIHADCAGGMMKTNNNDTKSIVVSPNPTSSIINFKGQNLKDYTISIYDTNGNKVIEKANIEKSINIGNQKRGIYIYKITDENGFVQEGKIIKQ